MGWWLEILKTHWNKLRDAVKKYGVLPVVILAIYFIGMAALLSILHTKFHVSILLGYE